MVSVIIKEHHIGDLASLYYKKNIEPFYAANRMKKKTSPAFSQKTGVVQL